MEIIISGGTNKDKRNLAENKPGLLEGFRCLASEFGELFDLIPTRILVSADNTDILNGYLPLYVNKQLTGELAMAEVFSLGGELSYINQSGYIITQFSLIPLGDAPHKETKHNATLYNMWWRDYQRVQHYLLDNVPNGVRAIRYRINNGVIIMDFKSKEDRRKSI